MRYRVVTDERRGGLMWHVVDTVRNEVVMTYQEVEGDTHDGARGLCDALNGAKEK